MASLVALVVCKNEAKRIGDCLASLDFCDDVLVVDSGSTDGTLEIIHRTKARLIERPFINCNDQKEFGRTQIDGDWVLNLDADEVVSSELKQEICSLLSAGVSENVAAFRVPFRNYFRGEWVRTCGYYPDPHIRLVRRSRAYWDCSAPIHDRVVVDGEVSMLCGHIDHRSFESITDFIDKSKRYSAGFAVDAYQNGQRAGLVSLLVRPAFRFFKAYVLQRGFREGSTGLVIAALQAYEVFQKYARLWELGRFGDDRQ